MASHGGIPATFSEGLENKEGHLNPAISSFRNFGVLGPVPLNDVFTGYGSADETHAILTKLVARMAEPYRFPDGTPAIPDDDDNDKIPAGFTYLAQLAAHDLVQSVGPAASLRARLGTENLRTRPLILDTIYGGGPAVEEAAFVLPAPRRESRSLFRLGRVAGTGQAGGEGECAKPLFRDLPRVRAKLASDASEVGQDSLPDVLIADPRNDNNAIIGQLTVLFKLLHNAIVKDLDKGNPLTPLEEFRIFARARRTVVCAYRSVLRHHLLERLLKPEVYAEYCGNGWQPIVDPEPGPTDERLPVEFAHAAFRLGHAMIRHAYRMRPGADRFGIYDVIRTSSSRRPGSMPITEAWVVQWSQFFELDSEGPQLSRRISPSYTSTLLSKSLFPAGDPIADRPVDPVRSGLLYRDLLRSSVSRLRRLKPLVDDLPDKIREQSPLLNLSDDERTEKLAAWLGAGATAFTSAELEKLSREPPLTFYLLFEAAHECNGQHFGTLGSVIVGDIFCGALRLTRDLVEAVEDPETGESAEQLLESVFANRRPAMGDLIRLAASGLPDEQEVPLV